MEALIGSGEFEELGSIHGAPTSICSKFCCDHDVLMLSWHRLFMVQMEDALGEPFPYWDWNEDVELPDLWEGLKFPIKEGASSHCEPGQAFITRKSTTEIDKEALRKTSKDALDAESFEEFHRQIDNPHSIVHNGVGCEMAVTAISAYDPIFYLHHAYVDLLFAYWQELHQLQGEGEPFVQEFNNPIEPFDRGEVKNGFKNENQMTLRNHKGGDTLNYKGNYCYEYDQLLFEGMTPAQYLQKKEHQFGAKKFRSSDTSGVPRNGTCGNVCTSIESKKHCEAVCAKDKDGKSLIKVFVGVILPREAPTGINVFDLCQAGTCIKGGKVGTFGKTTKRADAPSETHVDKKNFALTEVDVTEVMVKQGWTLKKPVEAKMTSSVVGNLPKPVVIFKELGEGGKVVDRKVKTPSENGSNWRSSAVKENRHYGDLLDKYSI